MQKNIFSIEVISKDSARVPELENSIRELGFSEIERVFATQLYWIKGPYTEEEIEKIAQTCLSESVSEDFSIQNPYPFKGISLEISYRFGVKDPVADSLEEAIILGGFQKPEGVKTGRRYILQGKLTKANVDFISKKLLYNPIIEKIEEKITPAFIKPRPYKFKRIEVPIIGMSNKELREISKRMGLALNIDEMTKIQEYFKNKKRNPTDCELETIAQTWSEHCVHKTFKGTIQYGEERIKGLFQKIMETSHEIKKPWCVVMFKDNAGIIELDDNYNLAIKVETHNHPSALEPYGGSATGIGGVIRDILGAGLGASPILNLDVFCVGHLDISHNELPSGVLHPKRILNGVVAGVRDYGNRMGIPTGAGAVYVDRDYLTNPLVFCGTVGILPKNKSTKRVKPNLKIVLLGGKTGRDGIHGATFSSEELHSASEETSIGAVQIGDPITEKKVQDALLAARDLNLYEFVTDVGGGGLSSAIGESGEATGADVFLDKVPLKYKGISYTEIWISESQERMIIGVPEKNLQKLKEVCKKYGAESTVIGEYTDTKKLRLFYQDNLICDLDMDFLHKGMPYVNKKAKDYIKKEKDIEPPEPDSPEEVFLKVLSSPNIRTRESIIRQYDHEVQGGCYVKPLIGIDRFSPSDAVIYKPCFDTDKKVAISLGLKPGVGKISPYWMAAGSIDETVRSLIAVGVSLDRIALLDNFCFANPDDEVVLGEIVETVKGACDFARTFGTPFISGKDSLNNEWTGDGVRYKIPPTLLITGIGIIEPDIVPPTTPFKNHSNLIYIIGDTYKELGGSEYYRILCIDGGIAPRVRANKSISIYSILHKAIRKKLITSIHDVSDGGIGTAIAEMTFAHQLGVSIDLSSIPGNLRWDSILFSESNSRFIVEIEPSKEESFLKLFNGLPVYRIGNLTAESVLKIEFGGRIIIETSCDKLYTIFSKSML